MERIEDLIAEAKRPVSQGSTNQKSVSINDLIAEAKSGALEQSTPTIEPPQQVPVISSAPAPGPQLSPEMMRVLSGQAGPQDIGLSGSPTGPGPITEFLSKSMASGLRGVGAVPQIIPGLADLANKYPEAISGIPMGSAAQVILNALKGPAETTIKAYKEQVPEAYAPENQFKSLPGQLWGGLLEFAPQLATFNLVGGPAVGQVVETALTKMAAKYGPTVANATAKKILDFGGNIVKNFASGGAEGIVWGTATGENILETALGFGGAKAFISGVLGPALKVAGRWLIGKSAIPEKGGEVDGLQEKGTEGQVDRAQALANVVGKDNEPAVLDAMGVPKDKQAAFIVKDSVGSAVRDAEHLFLKGDFEGAKRLLSEAFDQGDKLIWADGPTTEAEVNSQLIRAKQIESRMKASQPKPEAAKSIEELRMEAAKAEAIYNQMMEGKVLEATARPAEAETPLVGGIPESKGISIDDLLTEAKADLGGKIDTATEEIKGTPTGYEDALARARAEAEARPEQPMPTGALTKSTPKPPVVETPAPTGKVFGDYTGQEQDVLKRMIKEKSAEQGLDWKKEFPKYARNQELMDSLLKENRAKLEAQYSEGARKEWREKNPEVPEGPEESGAIDARTLEEPEEPYDRTHRLSDESTTYMGLDPGIIRREFAGMRSKLREVLDKKMKGPMPAADFLAMLKNNGVKEDEIRYSGAMRLARENKIVTPEATDRIATPLEETMKGYMTTDERLHGTLMAMPDRVRSLEKAGFDVVYSPSWDSLAFDRINEHGGRERFNIYDLTGLSNSGKLSDDVVFDAQMLQQHFQSSLGINMSVPEIMRFIELDKEWGGSGDYHDIPETRQLKAKGFTDHEADVYRRLRQKYSALDDYSRDQVERMSRKEIPYASVGMTRTKFHDYQLEGEKEGYRELLIRQPSHGEPITVEEVRDANKKLNDYADDLTEKYGLHNDSSFYDIAKVATAEEKAKLADLQFEEASLKADFEDYQGATYKSSHWDEKGSFLHLRMNIRRLKNKLGRALNVLFVEETQSDLHLKGKREGYRLFKDDIEVVPLSEYKGGGYAGQEEYARRNGFALVTKRKYKDTPAGDALGFVFTKEEAQDQIRYLIRSAQEAAPNAPFRKTWHEFLMKRAMQYAKSKNRGIDKELGNIEAEIANKEKQAKESLKEAEYWKTVVPPSAIHGARGRDLPLMTHSGERLDRHQAQTNLENYHYALKTTERLRRDIENLERKRERLERQKIHKVSWISGEDTAARYSLRKKIDELHVTPEEGGYYRLTGIKDGVTKVEKTILGKELNDWIPGELADKVREAEKKSGLTAEEVEHEKYLIQRAADYSREIEKLRKQLERDRHFGEGEPDLRLKAGYTIERNSSVLWIPGVHAWLLKKGGVIKDEVYFNMNAEMPYQEALEEFAIRQREFYGNALDAIEIFKHKPLSREDIQARREEINEVFDKKDQIQFQLKELRDKAKGKQIYTGLDLEIGGKWALNLYGSNKNQVLEKQYKAAKKALSGKDPQFTKDFIEDAKASADEPDYYPDDLVFKDGKFYRRKLAEGSTKENPIYDDKEIPNEKALKMIAGNLEKRRVGSIGLFMKKYGDIEDISLPKSIGGGAARDGLGEEAWDFLYEARNVGRPGDSEPRIIQAIADGAQFKEFLEIKLDRTTKVRDLLQDDHYDRMVYDQLVRQFGEPLTELPKGWTVREEPAVEPTSPSEQHISDEYPFSVFDDEGKWVYSGETVEKAVEDALDFVNESSGRIRPKYRSVDVPKEPYGTEYLYSGLPWPKLSQEAKKGIDFLRERLFNRDPEKAKEFFSYMRAAIELFAPTSTLPQKEAFHDMRNLAIGMGERGLKLAENLRERYKWLNKDQRKLLWDFMDGQMEINQLPQELRPVAARFRSIDNAIGRMMVKEKIISPATYKEMKGKHIRYVYNKYLAPGELNAGKGVGGKTEKGYQFKERKGLDPLQMEQHGIVEDPIISLADSIVRATQEIGARRYLKGVAGNRNWLFEHSVVTVNGERMGIGKVGRELEYLQDQEKHGLLNSTQKLYMNALKQAKSMAEGQSAAFAKATRDYTELVGKKYGPLDGMWVLKPIANDIKPLWTIQGGQDSKLLESIRKAALITTGIWKVANTALNPPTWFHNIWGNVFQMNMSGTPLGKVPPLVFKSLRQMRDNGPYYNAMLRRGVFRASSLKGELMDLIQETHLMGFEKKGLDGFTQYIEQLYRKAGEGYGKIDDVFKLAKAIEVMEAGKSAAEAAREANKWGMDYSLMHPALRYTRSLPFGAPFISYQAKILPLMAEALADRPWTIGKFIAFPFLWKKHIMNQMSEEDKKKFLASMPERISHGQVFILPDYENGYVDMTQIFPWGNWWQMGVEAGRGKFGKAIGEMGIASGAVPMLIYGVTTGRDPRTGESIEKLDPFWDKIAWLWDAAMPVPSVVGTHGVIAKIMQHEQFGKNEQGVPTKRYHVYPRMFGIDISPYDPNAGRRERKGQLGTMKYELRRQAKKQRRMRGELPEDVRRSLLEKYGERKKEILKEE